MEDDAIHLIEKLFYKKIMLYSDLLHYYKEERESLIRVDLDKLWKISNEKEDICSKILSTRHEIISAANPGRDQESFNLNRIMDLIPREFRAKFQNLYLRLIKYKGEIEALRKENMIFINDSLQFLDELMSIITGEETSKIMYNDKCHFCKPGPQLYLNREV